MLIAGTTKSREDGHSWFIPNKRLSFKKKTVMTFLKLLIRSGADFRIGYIISKTSDLLINSFSVSENMFSDRLLLCSSGNPLWCVKIWVKPEHMFFLESEIYYDNQWLADISLYWKHKNSREKLKRFKAIRANFLIALYFHERSSKSQWTSSL